MKNDAQARRLTVERIDRVPDFEWMCSVVVRLNDQMTNSPGKVLVGVTLRGPKKYEMILADEWGIDRVR
ncbi:MAG TPA: hypothetical protein VFZ44_11605 [Pyrinomonadaceae bacterium]